MKGKLSIIASFLMIIALLASCTPPEPTDVIVKNGDKSFDSLAEAVLAANDGDTLTIVQGISTIDEGISIQKSITIDGKGRKVLYSGERAAFEIGSDNLSVVLKNLVIESPYGGIWDFSTNSTLSIDNCIIKGDSYFALYHNGSYAGFVCEAKDSSFISTDACQGIYISGSTSTSAAAGKNQQLSLTNCTVTGSTGIEGKYTDMNLKDCTVTALAEKPTFEQYNNGSTAEGFAVVSTDNSMKPDSPKPTAVITIDGGTYKGLIGLSELIKAEEYPDFAEATYKLINDPKTE